MWQMHDWPGHLWIDWVWTKLPELSQTTKFCNGLVLPAFLLATFRSDTQNSAKLTLDKTRWILHLCLKCIQHKSTGLKCLRWEHAGKYFQVIRCSPCFSRDLFQVLLQWRHKISSEKDEHFPISHITDPILIRVIKTVGSSIVTKNGSPLSKWSERAKVVGYQNGSTTLSYYFGKGIFPTELHWSYECPREGESAEPKQIFLEDHVMTVDLTGSSVPEKKTSSATKYETVTW